LFISFFSFSLEKGMRHIKLSFIAQIYVKKEKRHKKKERMLIFIRPLALRSGRVLTVIFLK